MRLKRERPVPARSFVKPRRNPNVVTFREPHPGQNVRQTMLREDLRKLLLAPDEFMQLLEDCCNCGNLFKRSCVPPLPPLGAGHTARPCRTTLRAFKDSAVRSHASASTKRSTGSRSAGA